MRKASTTKSTKPKAAKTKTAKQVIKETQENLAETVRDMPTPPNPDENSPAAPIVINVEGDSGVEGGTEPDQHAAALGTLKGLFVDGTIPGASEETITLVQTAIDAIESDTHTDSELAELCAKAAQSVQEDAAAQVPDEQPEAEEPKAKPAKGGKSAKVDEPKPVGATRYAFSRSSFGNVSMVVNVVKNLGCEFKERWNPNQIFITVPIGVELPDWIATKAESSEPVFGR